MPHIPTNGISTHYEIIGEGRPVVFAHGLGGAADREVEWAGHAAESGYQIIVYSARGHGKSTPVTDPSLYSFDNFTDDLLALIDHLEIDDATFGGGSMGAAITLAFTLRHPERVKALMQFGPAFGEDSTGPVGDAFAMFADVVETEGVDRAIDLIISSLPDLQKRVANDPGMIDDLREQWSMHEPASFVAAMRGVPRGHPFNRLEDLESISVPTLIVATEEDPIHPMSVAKAYHKRIPSSELLAVEPDPPLYRRPKDMAAVVTDFLDRALP